MANKVNNSDKAPAAIGPYSHSIQHDNMLFVSGQLGIDPATGELKETVREQAIQGFENFKAIIEEAGFTFSDVVKTTVFLTTMDNFAEVNEVYSQYFTDWEPARSAIAVVALPKGGLFEMEAILVKD